MSERRRRLLSFPSIGDRYGNQDAQGALPDADPEDAPLREMADWTVPPASDESRERLLAAARVELMARRSQMTTARGRSARVRGEDRDRELRRRQPPRPEPSRRWPLMAVASTLAAAIIASIWWGTVTVSADEALSRAERAEVQRWQSTPQPIVHQRIELRLAHGATQQDVRWESWAASTGQVHRFTTEQPLQRSIVSRYLETLARNGLDQGPPLSAVAFARWRAQLPAGADREELVERVQTMETGPALRIHVRWPRRQAAGRIVDASVLLRTSDWHPIEQVLHVQTSDGGLERFDLAEHHVAIVSRDAMPRDRPADAPATVPSRKLAPASEVAAVSAAELADVETQALFALHQLHADRGEQIEVIRRTQDIEIRGVVDSADRRAAIEGALSHLPHTRFSVVQAARASAATPPPTAADGPVIAEAARDPPLWRFVDAYLRAAPAHDKATDADATARARTVNVFVQDVNSEAEAAVAEAWALRRLAERYPPETRVSLAEPSRRRLQEMTRDHLTSIRGSVARLRRVLEAVEVVARHGRGSEAGPERDTPAAPDTRRLSGPQVFLAVIDVERRLSELVLSDRRAAVAADDDDAVLAALGRLVASLTRLEQDLQLLVEQG